MKPLLAFVVLAFALALAPAALAAPSGPLRIAYAGDGSTAWGACTMNPDGSDNVCVSDGYRPVAAPGGKELYFQDIKDHDTTNYRAIYRSNADGTDLRMIVFNPFRSGPCRSTSRRTARRSSTTATTATACSRCRRSTSRMRTEPASDS